MEACLGFAAKLLHTRAIEAILARRWQKLSQLFPISGISFLGAIETDLFHPCHLRVLYSQIFYTASCDRGNPNPFVPWAVDHLAMGMGSLLAINHIITAPWAAIGRGIDAPLLILQTSSCAKQTLELRYGLSISRKKRCAPGWKLVLPFRQLVRSQRVSAAWCRDHRSAIHVRCSAGHPCPAEPSQPAQLRAGNKPSTQFVCWRRGLPGTLSPYGILPAKTQIVTDLLPCLAKEERNSRRRAAATVPLVKLRNGCTTVLDRQ